MFIKQGYLYSLGVRELNAFRSRLTVNYTGLENILHRGYQQTIYAVNHPSRFDPFIMTPSILHYADNKNTIRLPAAQWIQEKFSRLYKMKIFDWLAVSFVGEDKEKNKHALKQLEDHLQTHNQILIFPEGWYQRDGKMRAGMYGASSIALRCAQREDVSILPISITYHMKPKPKKRETLHGWLDLLWNIDEYLLDTIVEAKQYYHAEIDIHFGKAISINQLKKKYGTGDEAGLRRMITDVMMKEIGHLSVINMNQLLAQYLIKGYAAKLRVYDMESLYDDLALLTQEIVQMGYYSKENGTQNTLLPSLEQALILFEQQFLIKKKKISGLEKYIIDKNSKEYFDVVPDPSDDEFKDKNFLYYTANQISHLPEVCSLIEATVIKRKKDTIL